MSALVVIYITPLDERTIISNSDVNDTQSVSHLLLNFPLYLLLIRLLKNFKPCACIYGSVCCLCKYYFSMYFCCDAMMLYYAITVGLASNFRLVQQDQVLLVHIYLPQ